MPTGTVHDERVPLQKGVEPQPRRDTEVLEQIQEEVPAVEAECESQAVQGRL